MGMVYEPSFSRGLYTPYKDSPKNGVHMIITNVFGVFWPQHICWVTLDYRHSMILPTYPGKIPKTSPFTPKKKEFLHIQPVVVSHPFKYLPGGLLCCEIWHNIPSSDHLSKKKDCRYMTIIFPVALEGKTSGLCWVPFRCFCRGVSSNYQRVQ